MTLEYRGKNGMFKGRRNGEKWENTMFECRNREAKEEWLSFRCVTIALDTSPFPPSNV